MSKVLSHEEWLKIFGNEYAEQCIEAFTYKSKEIDRLHFGTAFVQRVCKVSYGNAVNLLKHAVEKGSIDPINDAGYLYRIKQVG